MKRLSVLVIVAGIAMSACGATGSSEPVNPGITLPPGQTPYNASAEPTVIDEVTPEPEDTPEVVEEVTPEPTPVAEGPKTFKPGDPITITSDDEDWATVVVSQVKQVKSYKGEYSTDKPKKGRIFIQAKVTYTALADGVDYNPYDWQVFVDGEAVDSSTFVLNGPETLDSGTLPKGRKASGWLVYEIPAKGKVLLSYGGTFSNEAPVFEVQLRAK